MIKFLKGNGWYFPAANVLALDTLTDTDNCVIHVLDEDGTTSDATLTAAGTASAAEGSLYAEALIEEINFGKKVVIDTATFFTEADGTAFGITKG
jgi:hypothetical protein